MIRFGSCCSGIEAASVAWHPLGWKAAWLSEIEPFPCAVLAHHYPDVPNLGDMTKLVRKVLGGEIEAPDVFTGGTPCQAFSVAGKRQSLDDARGNLTLTFVEIADAIDHVRASRGSDPCVVVWENVPGVLSTKDNAFGCFLGALAGAGCELQPAGGRWTDAGCVYGPARAVAWRVLDAQYFGLAQRRRRVFVVASARNGFDPAAVLFERDCVRRDSPPSREAWKGIAGGTSRRPEGGHVVNALTAINGQRNEISDVVNGSVIPWPADIACTLNAAFGDKQGLEDQHALSGASLFVPCVAHSLRGEGFDASEDGTGRGTPLVPVGVIAQNGSDVQAGFLHTVGTIGASQAKGTSGDVIAFSCKDHGADAGEIAPTLRSMGHDGSHPNAGGQVAIAIRTAQTGSNGWGVNTEGTAYTLDSAQQAVAFAQNQRDEVRLMDVAGALAAEPGAKQQTYMQQGMAVRRLTPTECERLQGFPDDYTAIPWRGKPAEQCPDGPRYKALGNSWAVPCVRWIGWRIQWRLEARAAA